MSKDIRVEEMLAKKGTKEEIEKEQRKKALEDRKKNREIAYSKGKGFKAYAEIEKEVVKEGTLTANFNLEKREKLNALINDYREELTERKKAREAIPTGFKAYANAEKEIVKTVKMINDLKTQHQIMFEQTQHKVQEQETKKEVDNLSWTDVVKKNWKSLVSNKSTSIDERIARIQEREREFQEKYPNFEVDKSISFDERAQRLVNVEKDELKRQKLQAQAEKQRIKERKNDFRVALMKDGLIKGATTARKAKNHAMAATTLVAHEIGEKTKIVPLAISTAIAGGVLWDRVQEHIQKSKENSVRKAHEREAKALLKNSEKSEKIAERERKKEVKKEARVQRSVARKKNRESKMKAYKLSMLESVQVPYADKKANDTIVFVASRVVAQGTKNLVNDIGALGKYAVTSVVDKFKAKSDKYQKLYQNFEQKDKEKSAQKDIQRASGYEK